MTCTYLNCLQNLTFLISVNSSILSDWSDIWVNIVVEIAWSQKIDLISPSKIVREMEGHSGKIKGQMTWFAVIGSEVEVQVS